MDSQNEALFRPITLGRTTIANRIAMAPMTRSMSPNGVPGPDVAAYYSRRAAGGVGLILTEGTYVGDKATWTDPDVPRFHGEDALEGWSKVARDVHRAGGRIMPQLWHVGLVRTRKATLDGSRAFEYLPELGQIGPSGYIDADEKVAEPMSRQDVDAVIAAFAQAAADAERIGFDGIELHAAHGYLIDQFFWLATNRRTDRYGGSLTARGRFAGDIVSEIRRRVPSDFPIILRISQWKQQDYGATIATTPGDLGELLAPAVSAGVDMIHCSQRRYWEPAFAPDARNLASWVKAVTGKPTMTVGSVGLDRDFLDNLVSGGTSTRVDLDRLISLLRADECDMVAVGRALIGDAAWVEKVRGGNHAGLLDFDPAQLASLE